MRKVTKKLFCILSAAAITAGAMSFAACGSAGFDPVGSDNSGAVQSNGGFVVATNDYYYFINGVDDYSSDNTYGNVVKSALMRVKKTDVAAKKNEPETVVPSLIVMSDYNAGKGFYIYGDRIYYATPNNVRNTSGIVENDWLDFKSVKMDGTDIKTIHRTSSNSLQYRFVEAGEGANKAVYLVYVDGDELHSINTESSENTLLADGGTYVFNDSDVTDPYVYYTMAVSDAHDTATDGGSTISYAYNQVYRVSADATEAPYEYTWDDAWLEENDAPYVNLGEIVLDGIGSIHSVTQYNHGVTEENKAQLCTEVLGYTYTLQSYENGGLYFTRVKTSTPGSTAGSGAKLFYLPESAIEAEGWNAVSGNAAEAMDVVANASHTSNASSSAIFYLDENGGHHYLYVDGQYIVRADVAEDGSVSKEVEIANNVSGASLVSIDTESDSTYDYVYFSRTSGNGVSVERAVFNGEKQNYANLTFENEDNSPYKPVKLLDVQHASGWFDFEIIDSTLFYANAQDFNGSYNYVYSVDLKNKDGALMNNVEIEALNEKYESIFSDDEDTGYLKELETTYRLEYANAIKHYFYTGDSELLFKNIEEASENGRSDKWIRNNLYTQEEQERYTEFVKEAANMERFRDESGTSYFTVNYFTTALGKMNEDDADAISEYWKSSVLLADIQTEETDESGLGWWAWLLIAMAIAAVVAGAVTVYIRRRNKQAKAALPKPEKMRVDTTDDKDVDVYHINDAVDETAEEPVEETAEEHAEEPADESAEESIEPSESEPEERAEEPAETAEEPAEEAQTEAEAPAGETESDSPEEN